MFTLLFYGCSQQPSLHVTDDLPKEFMDEDFATVLKLFQKNCQTTKAKKLYKELCIQAHQEGLDPKEFILQNFEPRRLIDNHDGDAQGLLTGYYLASINASKTPSPRYKYPIYATPSDLVEVDLQAIYPELKHYRLRGKVIDGKLVPYYPRSQQNKIDADVLCYCDSKIDRFFLEVQGSGVVHLDDGSTMHIGYANQNGYKYSSIGKYLIKIGAIKKEDISLQSIKAWLKEHPDRVDEVLYQNDSMVFFRQKQEGAYGALGVRLTPMRSVAVDRRFIKLGSMLYLDADLPDATHLSRIVFAQDTGGAIKGSVRADLFCGDDKKAEALAGALQSPLKLWIFIPKERDE
ncbi:MAG: MltA domain-containing protein [Epsilonproteobacteria bacterium]|nr:MltA domain-containing protein [Campylobacterota bacterium]